MNEQPRRRNYRKVHCTPRQTRDQRFVLLHILHRYPRLLSFSELVDEIATGPDYFGEDIAVEQSVHELVDFDLLYVLGNVVLPSPAALYFQKLRGNGWPEVKD